MRPIPEVEEKRTPSEGGIDLTGVLFQDHHGLQTLQLLLYLKSQQ